MIQILDCTLRDGGYYTNWDFDPHLIDTYIESFNHLPVQYLEIGYRSKPVSGYLGELFYCPIYILKSIKVKSNKKLVVILNEKDVKKEDIDELLSPCIGIISMIRIAVDPKNFERAIELAAQIKKMDFEVAFNVMYMSSWSEDKRFLELIPCVNDVADYFYMVDSYGGVFPSDVIKTYEIIKPKLKTKIGFHGHNNLELALVNTLTALECGVDIVDATVTGMGRGAGNLKSELLLTVLHSQGKIPEFNFNELTKIVDSFSRLQKEYEWGTNLPYMVSGASSLPQKEVMDWVGKRYYSFNSIIRALDNRAKGIEDNTRLPAFTTKNISAEKVMIVGGGASAVQHSRAVTKYLEMNPDIVVIHASSKNAMAYKTISNRQIFCLVGNEGYRMEEVFSGSIPPSAICVLPPFPRKMGTYIPINLQNSVYEISNCSFTKKIMDSHTAIALQTALDIGAKSINLVGYDGYVSGEAGKKEQELFLENEYLFDSFINFSSIKLSSLTPTSYSKLESSSIYRFLYAE